MSKPEGYAPDLFSEHARAAQLGLRVVEILTDPESAISYEAEAHAEWEGSTHECRCRICIGSRLPLRALSSDNYALVSIILAAMSSLGFLAPRETEEKT